MLFRHFGLVHMCHHTRPAYPKLSENGGVLAIFTSSETCCALDGRHFTFLRKLVDIRFMCQCIIHDSLGRN